jgi:hypothetical protein
VPETQEETMGAELVPKKIAWAVFWIGLVFGYAMGLVVGLWA